MEMGEKKCGVLVLKNNNKAFLCSAFIKMDDMLGSAEIAECHFLNRLPANRMNDDKARCEVTDNS